MKNRKKKDESNSEFSSNSFITSTPWQPNGRTCQSKLDIPSGITMLLLATNVWRYKKLCKNLRWLPMKGRLKKNNIIHSILAKALFQWIGIDIVRLLMITRRGNQYIVTAIDYFTKWLIAKALKEATARTVSKFIYQKIICEHRCLEVLQSD